MIGSSSRRLLLVAIFLTALVGGLAAPAAAGASSADAGATAADAAGAQENNSTLAPYYEGEQPQVDNESWMEGNENVSGPSLITYLSRAGTFVVGGDGEGSGPMLTGMLLLGAGIGVAVGAPIGLVGGGVLALTALWGVVGVGLAPQWLLPVFVFGLSIFAASAIRGVLR